MVHTYMGHNKTITIHNMNVYIIGPVIMSFNHGGNVMSFHLMIVM